VAAVIIVVLDGERGGRYLSFAWGDRGFAGRPLVAGALCWRWAGASIFDIADWPRHVAYDTVELPVAAVRRALRADDTRTVLGTA
jgi:hypothetical protein